MDFFHTNTEPGWSGGRECPGTHLKGGLRGQGYCAPAERGGYSARFAALFVFIFLAVGGLGDAAAGEWRGPATILEVGAWPAILAAGPTIPPPVPGTFEPWLLNLLFVLGVIALVLTIFVLIKQAFGRTPPMHVELEAVDKRYQGLERKVDLSATKEELRAIEKAFQDRVEQFFRELDRKRSEDVSDLHSKIEEEVRLVNNAGESRSTELHKKIDNIAVQVGEIRGRMQSRGGRGS